MSEIKHGLRERIKNAKSETEVKVLLAEGATYPTASDKTKRQWNVAAKNWSAPVKISAVAKDKAEKKAALAKK